MARTWAEKGARITVIAGMVDYTSGKKPEAYKGKYIVKEELSDGTTVIRCHVSESYNLNFLGRLWAYFSFVFSGTYAGLFKLKGKHDIIIVTSPPLFVGIIAYVLSIVKRIPFIFEVRDLWPESAIDTGVLQNNLIIRFAFWFENFIYKHAKLINVLTPAFRTTLIEKKGVDKNKVILIPNAADFAISEDLLRNFDAIDFRRELNVEDKFVITYVGAHGVANYLEQVLTTAKLLENTNAYFLLIGQGMEKERLKATAMKERITNVRFIDPVPKREVFKYILASDMGTSVLKKNDTFKTVYSNKTFDYMSCQKPILMAIDGVSRELVEAARAGSFVEPENPVDFSEKIRFYIANPAIGVEQGKNGYAYAKANFDRQVLAAKYFKIVNDVR